MDEFVKTQFKDHPSIAPMLTRNLFQNRVPMTVFQDLADKCEKMEKELKEVSSKADHALTVTKKK